MIPEFDKLSPTEIELMLRAPILACILIAGADGNIDRNEIKGAIELAQKKQKRSKANLLEFYRYIAEDFEDKLKVLIQSYPSKAAQRNPVLVEELSNLNKILPKLDNSFALAFYHSIKEIAQGTAEASGGLLGMNKVGEEEEKYLGLPMIKDPSR
ncbi:MAG TPA: hypothetical protein VK517_02400 [Cyclobacteriaceae bacterium]|nr:hypothetical protein [Cyclobacteriaceae bacterium]